MFDPRLNWRCLWPVSTFNRILTNYSKHKSEQTRSLEKKLSIKVETSGAIEFLCKRAEECETLNSIFKVFDYQEPVSLNQEEFSREYIIQQLEKKFPKLLLDENIQVQYQDSMPSRIIPQILDNLKSNLSDLDDTRCIINFQGEVTNPQYVQRFIQTVKAETDIAGKLVLQLSPLSMPEYRFQPPDKIDAQVDALLRDTEIILAEQTDDLKQDISTFKQKSYKSLFYLDGFGLPDTSNSDVSQIIHPSKNFHCTVSVCEGETFSLVDMSNSDLSISSIEENNLSQDSVLAFSDCSRESGNILYDLTPSFDLNDISITIEEDLDDIQDFMNTILDDMLDDTWNRIITRHILFDLIDIAVDVTSTKIDGHELVVIRNPADESYELENDYSTNNNCVDDCQFNVLVMDDDIVEELTNSSVNIKEISRANGVRHDEEINMFNPVNQKIYMTKKKLIIGRYQTDSEAFGNSSLSKAVNESDWRVGMNNNVDKENEEPMDLTTNNIQNSIRGNIYKMDVVGDREDFFKESEDFPIDLSVKRGFEVTSNVKGIKDKKYGLVRDSQFITNNSTISTQVFNPEQYSRSNEYKEADSVSTDILECFENSIQTWLLEKVLPELLWAPITSYNQVTTTVDEKLMRRNATTKINTTRNKLLSKISADLKQMNDLQVESDESVVIKRVNGTDLQELTVTPDTLAIKAVNNLDIKEQVLENIFHQKALNEENQCSSLAYEITTNRKEEKRKLIDFVPEPLLYHTEIDSTKQDDIIMVPEIPQSPCVESQDKEIVVKKENVTHREVENFKVDDNFESEKLIKLKEYYGNMECEDVVLVQNKVDDKDKKQKDVTMVSESLNNKVSNGVSMKPSDPVIKKINDTVVRVRESKETHEVCDWLLVDQQLLKTNLFQEITKLETVLGFLLISRDLRCYENEIIYPDIILRPHVGIFLLKKENEMEDGIAGKVDVVYRQNYKLFQKLWFLVLDDLTEQVYSEILAMQSLTSRHGYSCTMHTMLVSATNLASVLYSIYQIEEIKASIPIPEAPSTSEILLTTICPVLNPVQVACVLQHVSVWEIATLEMDQLEARLNGLVPSDVLLLLTRVLCVDVYRYCVLSIHGRSNESLNNDVSTESEDGPQNLDSDNIGHDSYRDDKILQKKEGNDVQVFLSADFAERPFNENGLLADIKKEPVCMEDLHLEKLHINKSVENEEISNKFSNMSVHQQHDIDTTHQQLSSASHEKYELSQCIKSEPQYSLPEPFQKYSNEMEVDNSTTFPAPLIIHHEGNQKLQHYGNETDSSPSFSLRVDSNLPQNITKYGYQQYPVHFLQAQQPQNLSENSSLKDESVLLQGAVYPNVSSEETFSQYQEKNEDVISQQHNYNSNNLNLDKNKDNYSEFLDGRQIARQLYSASQTNSTTITDKSNLIPFANNIVRSNIKSEWPQSLPIKGLQNTIPLPITTVASTISIQDLPLFAKDNLGNGCDIKVEKEFEVSPYCISEGRSGDGSVGITATDKSSQKSRIFTSAWFKDSAIDLPSRECSNLKKKDRVFIPPYATE